MFDGTKIQDLSVSADTLLIHDRLLFPLPIDEHTGSVLNRPRRATDQGLTFTLTPRLLGGGYRVELTGSLHRFHNGGLHNADDFTANNLLTALDSLVTTYNVDPFLSRLNNLEFGVNVQLPFPVARVLDNLVSYKNRPFYRDTRGETAYYQCETQRYIVKLYDKGHQYGLALPLLRVEVKVEKMEYLNRQGININALADLLRVSNYRRLGALLVNTFTEIVFDDPTINIATLTAKERSIYQDGRNPKFWQHPKGLTGKQDNTNRQRLSRAERQYRSIINRYGRGNWQTQTAALIGQKWRQLATVDDNLITQIDNHLTKWKSSERTVRNEGNSRNIAVIKTPEKCHKLTDPSTPQMSRINPLYLGLNCDTSTIPANNSTDSPLPGAVVCPVTGVTVSVSRGGGRRRFVSATMLRANDDLMLTLGSQHRQYNKGSKEDPFSRVAHNVRNKESNQRNNLRRIINKVYQTPTLFDLANTVRLTAQQRAALDYWKGTPYEVRL
jgi:hypothetical protein